MTLVVDASIAGAWCLADEKTDAADAVMDLTQAQQTWVPGHWWFEVRNMCLVNERRGRIDADGVRMFLSDLVRLPIAFDHEPQELPVLTLARRHLLTVYDAAYLELAIRRQAELATLDRKLAAAARAEGISTLPA